MVRWMVLFFFRSSRYPVFQVTQPRFVHYRSGGCGNKEINETCEWKMNIEKWLIWTLSIQLKPRCWDIETCCNKTAVIIWPKNSISIDLVIITWTVQESSSKLHNLTKRKAMISQRLFFKFHFTIYHYLYSCLLTRWTKMNGSRCLLFENRTLIEF